MIWQLSMRTSSRSRILAAVPLSLVFVGLAACRGRRVEPQRRLPTGISIEFSDEASSVPGELLPRLSAIGVRSVFVPAVRFGVEGGVPHFKPMLPPDSRYGLSVYLVVQGVGNLDEYLKSAAGRAGEEIWSALRPALSSGRYGEISGVHLDLRVANSAVEYASTLGAIRSKLPRGMTLSAEIETKLTAEQLKKWRSVGRQVDFLVPVVYGRTGQAGTEGLRASMSSADAAGLARAVFPAFCPQGWGVFQPRAGQARSVSDGLLNDLSEDRRFDFEFGSLLSDADENVYVFRPRQPGSRAGWGPRGFSPGDTVTYWENRPADFTQSLSDPLGAKGKIIRLRSLDDQDHLIGFSVIEDILLGRRLEPKLTFGRSAGSGEVTFIVLNSSPEYSELSRLNNWIDLRMEGGRLLDIRPGDFDRFQFLDSAGKQSVAARARTIRFFENFIAPGESMTGGPIRYSGEAEFFASAHVALPDGRVLTVGETPVATVPGGETPALPANAGRGLKSASGR
jgi:hypothetical protein